MFPTDDTLVETDLLTEVFTIPSFGLFDMWPGRARQTAGGGRGGQRLVDPHLLVHDTHLQVWNVP